jgi:acetyl/propionyl-CoA carboxylase alpha subunit
MIRRILVANRGEIARRVFRTCARLRIETVAVYSDTDAAAPHVADADDAVHLHGKEAAETYLNEVAILRAAAESGADAIHPGYGFLSENAAFAQAVIEAGLTWIGPPPHAMAAMGSKIEAKRLMEAAGVPCVPGADLAGLTDNEIREEALRIGYPVLIKASAGGGGKGMRTVVSENDLISAVEGARREAEGAFGDGTVFIENLLTGPRHIEIQIFGDDHGNIVSLHERECSIQRRHQKIIEESPSPVVTEPMRRRMGEAATAAARAVDYVGAGTVEFLYQDGDFFFLEMNTRLQVEHPVTEMVTGLDLVELQITVANGLALPGEALDPALVGHAIEARIYAEDPSNGFLPVTGMIHDFSFPPDSGVRVDTGVEPGTRVSVHFDPMLAKVIAHAPNRKQAAIDLASALRQARIHNTMTNRDLLVRILEHPVFLAADADTGFIESTGVATLAAPLLSSDEVDLWAVAAALADRASRLEGSPAPRTIPPGFRNVGTDRQTIEYMYGDRRLEVVYANRRGGATVLEPGGVTVSTATPSSVSLQQDGAVRELSVSRYGDVRFVDSEAGSARLVELSRYPAPDSTANVGSLHAPMPGRVVRVEVEVGDTVAPGAVLVVLEAMKMEHTLRSPRDGLVTEIKHRVGDQVETNDILIVIE